MLKRRRALGHSLIRCVQPSSFATMLAGSNLSLPTPPKQSLSPGCPPSPVLFCLLFSLLSLLPRNLERGRGEGGFAKASSYLLPQRESNKTIFSDMAGAVHRTRGTPPPPTASVPSRHHLVGTGVLRTHLVVGRLRGSALKTVGVACQGKPHPSPPSIHHLYLLN